MSIAGSDEVIHSDPEFIDDEINVRDQELSDYCLMNMMGNLQETI